MKYTRLNKQQRGFTILELMIATTVLAVILVFVSAMMIGIGNLYYKGVNQARVQDATRSILDDLSQHLQLSDVPPRTETAPLAISDASAGGQSGDGYSVRAYCTNNTRYSYVIGRQLGTERDADDRARIAHVLWRDALPSTGCSPADMSLAKPSATGSELAVDNSRLTAFDIGLTSPYSINIEMVIGDSDLFSGTGMDVTCKGGAGQQFCATSTLSTVVTQRITKSIN